MASDSTDGRGHWSEVYSCLFAGAGIAAGNVVGASDAHGAFVSERPVSPKDILHTVYHLLGIDPHRTTFPDLAGRPHYLLDRGEPIRELI